MFEENGISLSHPLTVNHPAIATGRLVIADKESKQAYIVKKDDDKLNIHKLPDIPKTKAPILVLKLKDRPQ